MTEDMSFHPAKRGGVHAALTEDGESSTGFMIMIEFGEEGPDEKFEVPLVVSLKEGIKGLDFKLGEQGVDLGNLQSFYNSAQKMFSFLPALDFSTLPEPIPTIAAINVKVEAFEINTGSGKLRLDVKFTPDNMTLPFFDNIKIKYAELMLDRKGSETVAPTVRR